MIIIVDYSKLLEIIAIICLKFYNVYERIIVLIENIGIYVLACALHGWYKMWMADIRCTLTDLGGKNCDGEEFQPI
jgi:hypothetical protein